MKAKHQQYLDHSQGGMRRYLMEEGPFAGIVVDDDDPERRGRVRVRVPALHGQQRDIPDDALPWCDAVEKSDGRAYKSPEVGKVTHVEFPQGDLYHPKVHHVEHYDPSLQAKLDEYRGDEMLDAYRSFQALIYEAGAQVWTDLDQGLVMDYNMSKINIDADRNIHVELQDPSNRLNLVHRDADQNLINGPNFFEWMDEFMQHMIGSALGPYLGNLGAPVIANPAFIQVVNKYFSLRNSKFLNWYAFVRDNRDWQPLERISWDQAGDDIESRFEKTADQEEPTSSRDDLPDTFSERVPL